jgi:hypothetical protein
MKTVAGAVARTARLAAMLALGVLLPFAGPAPSQAQPFVATKAFAPATILSGGTSTLIVSLQNNDKILTASLVNFSTRSRPGWPWCPASTRPLNGGFLSFAANSFTFNDGALRQRRTALSGHGHGEPPIATSSPTRPRRSRTRSAESRQFQAFRRCSTWSSARRR